MIFYLFSRFKRPPLIDLASRQDGPRDSHDRPETLRAVPTSVLTGPGAPRGGSGDASRTAQEAFKRASKRAQQGEIERAFGPLSRRWPPRPRPCPQQPLCRLRDPGDGQERPFMAPVITRIPAPPPHVPCIKRNLNYDPSGHGRIQGPDRYVCSGAYSRKLRALVYSGHGCAHAASIVHWSTESITATRHVHRQFGLFASVNV